MEECVFCKIVSNEIESFKVYEDDEVLAILDKNPVSLGHTLILPKKHYENIFDVPDEILEKMIHVAKMLAKKYKEKLNATGVNILNASGKDAQQSVFHFHIHLVPRYPNDNLDLWFDKKPKLNVKLEEVYNEIVNSE